jgi:hypothetical protein
LQDAVQLKRIAYRGGDAIDCDLAPGLFLQQSRELGRHGHGQLKRGRLRHRASDGGREPGGLKRALRRHSGHQILKRRIDHIGLESPYHLVAFGFRAILLRIAHGSQKCGKARVGDDYEPLVSRIVFGASQQDGLAVMLVHAQRQIVERVIVRDEKETALRRPPYLAHARQVAQRPFRHRRQTLYHKRRKIILKNHVLKITMNLRNRLLSTANRG